MKWRTFSVATIALLILPLGTYAAQLNQKVNNNQESTTNMLKLAQHQVKHGRKHRRGEGIKRLLEQLDLTPEQSQEIEAIQEKSRTEKDTLRQQIQTKHQEMRSLFTSDSTPEQLREQHEQLQALHQQLATNRFEKMLKIREILTPEQRTQMAELMAQRGGKQGRYGRYGQ